VSPRQLNINRAAVSAHRYRDYQACLVQTGERCADVTSQSTLYSTYSQLLLKEIGTKGREGKGRGGKIKKAVTLVML
jgi:hypothetical protein